MSDMKVVFLMVASAALMIFLAWLSVSAIRRFSCKYPSAAPERFKKPVVGGFLLFFIFVLMFWRPLGDLSQIAVGIISAEKGGDLLKNSSDWSLFKSVIFGVYIISSLLNIYAGIGLIKGRTRAVVNRAITIVWINGPVLTILYLAVIPLVTMGFGDGGDLVVQLFSSLLFSIFWTAYLMLSKRVKAVYG